MKPKPTIGTAEARKCCRMVSREGSASLASRPLSRRRGAGKARADTWRRGRAGRAAKTARKLIIGTPRHTAPELQDDSDSETDESAQGGPYNTMGSAASSEAAPLAPGSPPPGEAGNALNGASSPKPDSITASIRSLSVVR